MKNVLLLTCLCLFSITRLIGQYNVSPTTTTSNVNDAITITLNDVCGTDNDNFWSCGQTEVYLYAGVETDAGPWKNVVGTIDMQNTLGVATAAGANSFSITITPSSYFNIPSGTLVKGINLLFVNQYYGSNAEHNNKTDDQYIDLADATVGSGGNGGGGGSNTNGAVTVTPATPTPDEAVTIDFDAAGTDLAGASQVYLHSGVSITPTSPTSFDQVVGNWGMDDGIGEMTNQGGDNWQITLPSLRAYYSVAAEDDVFGLNFLFRNVAGTMVEDASGVNYFNEVNPGDYFTLDTPASSPHPVQTGTTFSVAATGTIAGNWTLAEVDANGNNPSTITTQSSVSAFSHNLSLSTTDLKYYKLTADFNGTVKCKFFSVKPYEPVGEASRPAGMKPGINYHADDPTKATLILHAPTYTRYKKGTGTVSGQGNTDEKQVVYVIGDFNNWTLDDAYKMYRDRDGWDGATDADNDFDRGDYWWIELTGLTPGQEYVFQYYIDGGIQVADPYTEKVSDPDDHQIDNSRYPNLVNYRVQAVDRAAILQTGQAEYVWTAPPFNKPTNNKLNIYELHFRDFTEEGTYLAAIEKLDYIKNMGINAIHVMPVSEFEGNSSWGYNPNFYFAPDKYYGTKNDLKKFIDECHKRQIQVFNDLVLNHCFYSNVMAKMYWNEAANLPADENPWINSEHKMVYNPAGWWGADWNHESEHTQAMIDDILDFWLQEYQFDGFRFDFTKGFGQSAQNSNDEWASNYNQERVDLLKRMVDGMWARNPGAVAIFEHLAVSTEDRALADHGILMWSGVGHHNDMKEFILGYDESNANIYNSGIYNAPGREFTFQNWISYMESHDEERLAYELMQYGNGIKDENNMTTKVAKTIDRLKIGAAFNMLFPGPRMIWQFGELGYDYSINDNGRTGEKPVRWDYYDDPKRKELYNLYSTALTIRNTQDIYATTPDYGNIHLGSFNITTPRRMKLTDGDGNTVIVIANLDPNAGHTITPGYDATGTWHKYNGDPNVDGTTYNVNSMGDTYSLAPSETLILTSFKVEAAPLAVEGLTFAAHLKDNVAHLKWETDTEQNNRGFYIEKSADGKHFEEIAFVTGNGTTTTSVAYHYTDIEFKNKAYYRLRQVDIDGQVTLSKVVFLEKANTTTPQFFVAPNPWTAESQLLVSENLGGSLTVEIVNTAGVTLHRSSGDLSNINQTVQTTLQNLTRGSYYLRLYDGARVQVLRVVR